MQLHSSLFVFAAGLVGIVVTAGLARRAALRIPEETRPRAFAFMSGDLRDVYSLIIGVGIYYELRGLGRGRLGLEIGLAIIALGALIPAALRGRSLMQAGLMRRPWAIIATARLAALALGFGGVWLYLTRP